LTELATGNFGADTALIRKSAKAALDETPLIPDTATKLDIAHNVTVYPDTRALPRTMIEQDWQKSGGGLACLSQVNQPCDAFFADLDGDGNEEVILITGTDFSWYGTVMKEGPDKIWRQIANVNSSCSGMLSALKKGQATVAMPAAVLRDWVILGVHVHPQSTTVDATPCPG
jgi:hypothetical protein